MAFLHEAARQCKHLAREEGSVVLAVSYGFGDDTASLAAGRCRTFAL